MSTTREKIAVMQAWLEGKTIQRRPLFPSKHGWITFIKAPEDPEPYWNFPSYEYRVKPEPVESWAVQTPAGNVYLYSSADAARVPAATMGGRVVLLREVYNDN